MKKLQFKILFFIFTSIVLFSCELVDGEKIIKIDSNPFTPGVVRVHVAVLDGEDVLSQKVYEQEDVNEDGVIEIYTTPGADRTFVVVAENDQGYASHFASDTVDIDNDGKAVVELSMKSAVWSTDGPKIISTDSGPSGDEPVWWESAGIVHTKYYVAENTDRSHFAFVGYGSQVDRNVFLIENIYVAVLIVEFYPFGLKTAASSSFNVDF